MRNRLPTAFAAAVLTLLAAGQAARAADPANDGARRCASIYGEVMRAHGEGSAAYMAALEGRLALLNGVEAREGRLDGPAVVASDDRAEAEFKGNPAGLGAAVAACDRTQGQTVASGLPRDNTPYVPPRAEPTAAPAPARVDRCDELDKKAAELINTWTFRREEVLEDPYDDKLRRLRDSYDTLHEKLEWVRDDAQSYGCSTLAGQISNAFTTWERP